jgi:hypothetical protein
MPRFAALTLLNILDAAEGLCKLSYLLEPTYRRLKAIIGTEGGGRIQPPTCGEGIIAAGQIAEELIMHFGLNEDGTWKGDVSLSAKQNSSRSSVTMSITDPGQHRRDVTRQYGQT